MAKTLQQILGQVYLTKLVEDVKTGIPDRLPPAFSSVKRAVPMDSGRYTRMAGVRTTARRTEYGSSPVQRKLQPVGSFDVKLLNFAEEIRLSVPDYMSLRGYTNYGPMERGMEEVRRQAKLFRDVFDNTRLALVYSMLANGKIWFDSEGNILPTSSGASLTVDYGVNANNQNQLNSIITASWATAGTDIPVQLRNLKKRSAQLTGYPLKYAFYGVNIPSYFANNTAVQVYLSRNPSMNDEWLRSQHGEIPDGLFGFTWVPVYEAFYEDSGGTNREFFGVDAVIFTPEIDASVYENIEGTNPVPTSFQPQESLESARGSFADRVGMYSYATAVAKPATADIVAGDCSLPAWLIPDCLFQADVTP